MELAKVTSTSPLEVKLKTAPDGSSTAVQATDSVLPALSEGDDVLVGFFDRKLVVLHKLEAV